MRVLHCVGARPNFVKMAPVLRAIGTRPGFEQTLLHSGQHYDNAMSQAFFDELQLPRPDVNLGVGSFPRLEQIWRIRKALSGLLPRLLPDLVLLYGDVNSTLACAFSAAAAGIPVAHVEAGLRSFDESMPEEVNRVLTDRLASMWFTHSPEAADNLDQEGLGPDGIHFVGNTMIDTLVSLLPLTDNRRSEARPEPPFALATFHRPSNVDDAGSLGTLLLGLQAVAGVLPVVWPVHPRVRNRLPRSIAGVSLVEPLGYLDFLTLERRARIVLTDSGGVQEETTFLGVPCLTVRENTERPITITHGTNQLVHLSASAIRDALNEVLDSTVAAPAPPDLWDGHAGERIAALL